MDLAAVILTGGTAARLDGVDKAGLELGGRTFLERALAAVRDADEVVVVGPEVPTTRPATFVREDPPRGGPVAGLVAGRRALARTPEAVVVLAVDMPWVTAETVARLVAASDGHDGAALRGPDGRRRLVLVLRTGALDAAAPPDPHGASVGSLVSRLDLAEVDAEGHEARGVDTWRDLRDLPDAPDLPGR
jgi:molybdopterin-guanine dinucleotide biosynthesis protein A